MSVKTYKELNEKWGGLINAGEDKVKSTEVKKAMARVLENTTEVGNAWAKAKRHINLKTGEIYESREQALNESGTEADHIQYQDPVLVTMVRRTMPSLIAFDVLGVQPMTGPTGLLFAIKSWYGSKESGNEALGIDEPNKDFAAKLSTAAGEDLGRNSHVNTSDAGAAQDAVVQTNPWPEMEMDIVKSSVTAETRKLKARYTRELAQDLRNTHGLDAEMEISNMLVSEIVAEQNREMVTLINTNAKAGAQQAGLTTAGTYDLDADSDGRWSVEKYKELMTFVHRESQIVARETRRGLANFIITTADIAAALAEASRLDTTFETQGLSFDGIGVTYAGLLSGRYKLYIDAYATTNYITLGYKGASQFDAGIIWAPYVGLERLDAIGEEDFQPRIGYQTRYGIANNPFVTAGAGNNQYYRKFTVANM